MRSGEEAHKEVENHGLDSEESVQKKLEEQLNDDTDEEERKVKIELEECKQKLGLSLQKKIMEKDSEFGWEERLQMKLALQRLTQLLEKAITNLEKERSSLEVEKKMHWEHIQIERERLDADRSAERKILEDRRKAVDGEAAAMRKDLYEEWKRLDERTLKGKKDSFEGSKGDNLFATLLELFEKLFGLPGRLMRLKKMVEECLILGLATYLFMPTILALTHEQIINILKEKRQGIVDKASSLLSDDMVEQPLASSSAGQQPLPSSSLGAAAALVTNLVDSGSHYTSEMWLVNFQKRLCGQ